MEQKTELKTYRIDKQCDKCNKGLMIKTGNSINNTFVAKYEHKCNNCKEVVDFTDKYYPRIVYEDEVKFTEEQKESVKEYLKDLNLIVEKIKSDTDKLEDYWKFEELVDVLITDKNITKGIFESFGSADKFFEERKKGKTNIQVSEVIGRIKGTVQGITLQLTKFCA